MSESKQERAARLDADRERRASERAADLGRGMMLGVAQDAARKPTLTEFVGARLDEKAATAHYAGPARVAWLTFRDDNGQLLYTTVAAAGAGDEDVWAADGKELPEPASVRVVYDPAAALREVEAGQKRLALMAEATAEMNRLLADQHAGRGLLIRDVLDRKPLLESHAEMLERGTDVPARLWLSLERGYRNDLAAGRTDTTPVEGEL